MRLGECARRHVDQEELARMQVHSVGVTDRPEREREKHLGAEVPAEELEPLAPVLRDAPRGSQARRGPRARPSRAATERQARATTSATSASTIAPTTRPEGAASAIRLVSMSKSTNGSSDSTSTTRRSSPTACRRPRPRPPRAVGAPICWRKRTLNAIRPAELGTVRLMNLTAEARAMHGQSGSGVEHGSAQRDRRCHQRSWARISPTTTQAGSASRSCVGDRPEADLGELRDEQVRREPDERRS